MKKFALLSLVALFLTAYAAAQCGSNCLFYGGDLNLSDPNQNGLANENDAIVGGNPYGAATYQNFTIKDPDWDVTSLFTNNLSQLNPASGYWEIRSGVSEGNGGTLIASGTASGGNFSHTPTGRSDFGYTEYRDHVMFPSIDLNSGQYWFAVVPNDPNNPGRSFNSNTDGTLNAVGSQTSNLQFFNSAFFGANFTNANSQGTFPIFSSGVDGTVTPEPSSLIMLGSGLVAAVGVVRRRLSR